MEQPRWLLPGTGAAIVLAVLPTRLSRLLAKAVAWESIDGMAGTTMLAMSASVALGG